MQSIGVSAALGAFVAGVMLAESPYRHELEADIDPFRSILLGLFFLAVGMMLDLDVIAAQPMLIVGLAAGLVLVKTAVIFGLGRLFGLNNRASIIMALLLSQGGEFGFVLFTASQNALLIEPEAASLFGAVVTLSMATTPFLMILAGRLAARRRTSDVALDDPEHRRHQPATIDLRGTVRPDIVRANLLAEELVPSRVVVHRSFPVGRDESVAHLQGPPP